MSVSWMEWNAVIPMPIIKCGLDLVWWDGGNNRPGRLRVVSLAWGVLVKSGVVDNSPGGAIRFGSDDHSAAPRDRIVNWNLL